MTVLSMDLMHKMTEYLVKIEIKDWFNVEHQTVPMKDIAIYYLPTVCAAV